MKNVTILILLIALSFAVSGQDKKTIKEKGISEIKTYEQKLERGIEDKFLVEIEKFDAKGRTIELKETSRKGDIDSWVKYKYDEDGNVVEETELDVRGKLKKKEITKYKNGLRIEREYYDSENRLVRRKTYEYLYD